MLSILINAVLIISALAHMHIHTSVSHQKVISNFINRSNKAWETTLTQHYQDVHSKQFDSDLHVENHNRRSSVVLIDFLFSIWQHIERVAHSFSSLSDWLTVGFWLLTPGGPEVSTGLFFIPTIPFPASQITELWLQAWLEVLICYH